MKLMKAAISLFLVSAIFLIGVMTVSAESDALDKATAVELVSEFVEIRNSMGLYFGWFEGGTSRDYIGGTIPEADLSEGHPDTPMGPVCKYVKVKDGYSPEDVKQMIRDLFVSELAEKVIGDGERFFSRYFEENGKWYYEFYQGGEIYSYDEGDRQNTFFELYETDNIVILESNGQHAKVSVPVHRFYDENDGDTDTARLLTDVVFELSFSDGRWKIAGFDFGNMIFRADGTNVSKDDLTEATVREGLIALVSDLYSMTMLSAECRFDTYSPSKKDYRHLYREIGGNTYAPMEGDLSDPEIWYAYAEKYCSPEVAGYLLDHLSRNERTSLRVIGDKVYFRFVDEFNYYDGDRADVMNTYCLKNALTDSVTIEEISENKAKAKVSAVIRAEANKADKTVELTLDYEKGEDGWRIVNTGFIDVLDEEVYALTGNGIEASWIPNRNANPETGDAGVLAIIVAAALALAVLTARRRRIQ